MAEPEDRPRISVLTVVFVAWIACAISVLLDALTHETPSGLALRLCAVITAFAVPYSIAGLAVAGALHLERGRSLRAIVTIRGLTVAALMAWWIHRTTSLLFAGSQASRIDENLGGAGPFLAGLVMLCVAGAGSAVAFACWRARTGRGILAVTGVLFAMACRWIDATVYPGQYGYLHELVAACVPLGLIPTLLVLTASRPAASRGGPGAAGVALLLMIAVGTWHVRTFADEPLAVRGAIASSLGGTSRLHGLLPLRRAEREEVTAGELSERARNQERLRAAARDELELLTERRRTRPDVIYVSIDAVRTDHTSLHGYERETTPFLESITKRCFVFENARSPSTASFFSLLSMQSGTWPSTISARAGEMPERLADRLGRRGYRTACRYPYRVHAVRPHDWPQADRSVGFEDHANNELARDGVEEILALRTRSEKPLYVWAHLMDPHAPYEAHERYDFGSSDIDRYDGEIRIVDDALKHLWSRIEELGGLDDTIIVFTSDHGESFGEHNLKFHNGPPWEAQTRVPLMIWVPWLEDRARRIDAPVSVASVPATLMDLLGLEPLAHEDAPSLSPLLLGMPMETLSVVEVPALPQIPDQGFFRAVATRRYKLIDNLQKDIQRVYDLETDPDERHDLATSRPDLLERMLALQREWQTDVATIRARRSSRDAMPAEYLALRAEVVTRNMKRAEELAAWLMTGDASTRLDAGLVLFDAEVEVGPGTTSQLARAHEVEDARVRALAAAVRWIRELKDAAAPLDALASDEVEVRRRVAEALHRRPGDWPDEGAVRDRLAVEPDPVVRAELGAALAARGDRRVTAELLADAVATRGTRLGRIMETVMKIPDAELGEHLDTVVGDPRLLRRSAIFLGWADSPRRRALIDGMLRSARLADRINGILGARHHPDAAFKRSRLAAVTRHETSEEWRLYGAWEVSKLDGVEPAEALLQCLAAWPATAGPVSGILLGRRDDRSVYENGVFVRANMFVGSSKPLQLAAPTAAGSGPSRVGSVAIASGTPSPGDVLVLTDANDEEIIRVDCSTQLAPFFIDWPESGYTAPFSLKMETRSKAETIVRLPGFVIVPRHDTPRRLWPADLDASAPYVLSRLSDGWTTRAGAPGVAWLEVEEGRFIFHPPQKSAASRVELRFSARREVEAVVLLNGTALRSVTVPAGDSTESIALSAGLWRAGRENALRLTIPAEARGELGLRRVDWR